MNWLLKFNSLEVYKYTTKEILDQALFHGTCESIIGNLKPGGDGLFWMAESPAIAQSYIPESGSYLMFPVYELSKNQTIVPDKGFNYSILCQMGYASDYKVKWENDRAISWTTTKSVKNNEVKDYIEKTLGYEPKNNMYKIRFSTNKDGTYNILKYNEKKQGSLYIMLGKEKLQIKDLTEMGFDLTNPAYLQFNLFSKIEQQGYDGVRINDYAQTEEWGNLGHVSIGIFKSSLDKLSNICIPAKNHTILQLGNRTTEEFLLWHKQEVEKALKEGKSVPESVLKEYSLKENLNK